MSSPLVNFPFILPHYLSQEMEMAEAWCRAPTRTVKFNQVKYGCRIESYNHASFGGMKDQILFICECQLNTNSTPLQNFADAKAAEVMSEAKVVSNKFGGSVQS
jgi:hypothetical protein